MHLFINKINYHHQILKIINNSDMKKRVLMIKNSVENISRKHRIILYISRKLVYYKSKSIKRSTPIKLNEK